MSELHARLALFSAIEGGHVFWSQELSTNGAEYVYQKLKAAGYDLIKYAKVIERVRAADINAIACSIENTGAEFITPDMEQWPSQLNELAAVPIGLVVKGNIEILKERGLAIVGTRNPTPYGVRNAGDFAAGFVDREWTIVSGGAYGIDSAAHKGALIAEGSTVA
ncbi:MAG: hypothetical protein RIR15_423, partial [Actinomycetota bacterium]